MRIQVLLGDVLRQESDVLVCSGNSLLRMTGGVNGALLQMGAIEVQRELEEFLRQTGKKWVPPGTVVRTSSGPVRARYIVHAVAVDGFYKSSGKIVEETLRNVFTLVKKHGGRTLSGPALACGYGPLRPVQFFEALGKALDGFREDFDEFRLVLRKPRDLEEIRAFAAAHPLPAGLQLSLPPAPEEGKRIPNPPAT